MQVVNDVIDTPDMQPKDQIVNRFMDGVLLMANANMELNIWRREALNPELHSSYRYLCAPLNPITTELFEDDLRKAVKDITDTNRITSKLSRKTKHSFIRSRTDGHSDRYTKAGIRIITPGHQKTTVAPSSTRRIGGGGGGGCSEEPELTHDQNMEVRDRDLQVAGSRG